MCSPEFAVIVALIARCAVPMASAAINDRFVVRIGWAEVCVMLLVVWLKTVCAPRVALKVAEPLGLVIVPATMMFEFDVTLTRPLALPPKSTAIRLSALTELVRASASRRRGT